MSIVNVVASVFIIVILCLIIVIIAAYRFQYRIYRQSKLETSSISDSIGSSTDLSDQHSRRRFSSLHTIAEVLSMASLPFSRRDASGNYTQLSDRNCVPLRIKKCYASMPSSPFFGRAPPPFMRKKNGAGKFAENRRSASCDELESRFIFPITEENIMTSSMSESEIRMSSKDDSGNESLCNVSTKKQSSKGKPKKPQVNKGNFAYITKVKCLGGKTMKKNNIDADSNFPKAKNRLMLSLRKGGNGSRQSPVPGSRRASVSNVHSNSTSELSMTGGDLEFDYYDYDMENASAIPGSLFGLDPTLMPWLPSILNIQELNEETEVYSVAVPPLSASRSTLKHEDKEAECIPMQDMSDKNTPNETPVSCDSAGFSASKAISLSSTDNSDEIPFADDSDEDL